MSDLAAGNLGLRSMWETLMAAASTFALFVAANWGDVDFYDQVFRGTVFRTVMPLVKLCRQNVNSVSSVKRMLGATMLNHGTIAIITMIPIYIRFPASTLMSDELHNLKTARGYQSITEENELKHLCPLELYPASCSHAPPKLVNNSNASSKDATATNTISSSNGTNAINTDVNATHTIYVEAINTDVNSISIKDENVINTDVNAIDTDVIAIFNTEVNAIKYTEASNTDQLMVLRLPARKTKEKEVLLRLGLAPTYKELSFLRSRNRFQTIVTSLQAAGYMLTVLERLLENLGVSPVEAFVTLLCITMCIQLLIMELYACSNYQRPLLLRLNAHQLRALYTAMPRDDLDDTVQNWQGFLFFCLKVIYATGQLGLSMYYFVHYVHSHFIGALAALLFFLTQVLPAIFFPCLELWSTGLFVFMYLFMYVSSVILALVSTIVEWEAFQEANQKSWYAWILPHVSS